jgi:hypothetical protein
MECKKCGAIYELGQTDLPFRDKDSIHCDFCGSELYSWNTSATYSTKLISGPTKNYKPKNKAVVSGKSLDR